MRFLIAQALPPLRTELGFFGTRGTINISPLTG
jgi:hypothetical protein